MNFKSRAFGIIAGTAFTLSLVSGVIAQEEDPPSLKSSATLRETACSIAFADASSANFGTWKYDHNARGEGQGGWVPDTNGTNSIQLTVVDSAAGRQSDCPVGVGATALGKGGDSIPVTLAWPQGNLSVVRTNNWLSGFEISVPAMDSTIVTISISNPLEDYPTGLYQGTIQLDDFSNVAP